jgi:hypothetical protein
MYRHCACIVPDDGRLEMASLLPAGYAQASVLGNYTLLRICWLLVSLQL